MPIEHVSTCPPWCDPRTHIDHGPDDAEHRSAGLRWKPVAADTRLTVSTVSMEDRSPTLPSVSEPMVHLNVLDPCAAMDGSDATAGTDLDPEDAEMLAAALVCEAKRVRALRARAA